MARSWKKRWFVLTSFGNLKYYEDERKAPIDTLPLGGSFISELKSKRSAYPAVQQGAVQRGAQESRGRSVSWKKREEGEWLVAAGCSRQADHCSHHGPSYSETTWPAGAMVPSKLPDPHAAAQKRARSCKSP